MPDCKVKTCIRKIEYPKFGYCRLHYRKIRLKDYIEKYDIEYTKSGKKRISRLKSRYGITIQEYNTLFKAQKGRCQTCLTHSSYLVRPLNVDHSHNTGKIRGLLCDNCNKALGLIKDNKNTLKNMIGYLI